MHTMDTLVCPHSSRGMTGSIPKSRCVNHLSTLQEVELLQREEMSLTEENEEIRAAIKKYQSTGLPLDRILFLTDRKGYVEKDILRTRQKLELSAAGKSQMVRASALVPFIQEVISSV